MAGPGSKSRTRKKKPHVTPQERATKKQSPASREAGKRGSTKKEYIVDESIPDFALKYLTRHKIRSVEQLVADFCASTKNKNRADFCASTKNKNRLSPEKDVGKICSNCFIKCASSSDNVCSNCPSQEFFSCSTLAQDLRYPLRSKKESPKKRRSNRFSVNKVMKSGKVRSNYRPAAQVRGSIADGGSDKKTLQIKRREGLSSLVIAPEFPAVVPEDSDGDKTPEYPLPKDSQFSTLQYKQMLLDTTVARLEAKNLKRRVGSCESSQGPVNPRDHAEAAQKCSDSTKEVSTYAGKASRKNGVMYTSTLLPPGSAVKPTGGPRNVGKEPPSPRQHIRMRIRVKTPPEKQAALEQWLNHSDLSSDSSPEACSRTSQKRSCGRSLNFCGVEARHDQWPTEMLAAKSPCPDDELKTVTDPSASQENKHCTGHTHRPKNHTVRTDSLGNNQISEFRHGYHEKDSDYVNNNQSDKKHDIDRRINNDKASFDKKMKLAEMQHPVSSGKKMCGSHFLKGNIAALHLFRNDKTADIKHSGQMAMECKKCHGTNCQCVFREKKESEKDMSLSVRALTDFRLTCLSVVRERLRSITAEYSLQSGFLRSEKFEASRTDVCLRLSSSFSDRQVSERNGWGFQKPFPSPPACKLLPKERREADASCSPLRQTSQFSSTDAGNALLPEMDIDKTVWEDQGESTPPGKDGSSGQAECGVDYRMSNYNEHSASWHMSEHSKNYSPETLDNNDSGPPVLSKNIELMRDCNKSDPTKISHDSSFEHDTGFDDLPILEKYVIDEPALCRRRVSEASVGSDSDSDNSLALVIDEHSIARMSESLSSHLIDKDNTVSDEQNRTASPEKMILSLPTSQCSLESKISGWTVSTQNDSRNQNKSLLSAPIPDDISMAVHCHGEDGDDKDPQSVADQKLETRSGLHLQDSGDSGRENSGHRDWHENVILGDKNNQMIDVRPSTLKNLKKKITGVSQVSPDMTDKMSGKTVDLNPSQPQWVNGDDAVPTARPVMPPVNRPQKNKKGKQKSINQKVKSQKKTFSTQVKRARAVKTNVDPPKTNSPSKLQDLANAQARDIPSASSAPSVFCNSSSPLFQTVVHRQPESAASGKKVQRSSKCKTGKRQHKESVKGQRNGTPNKLERGGEPHSKKKHLEIPTTCVSPGKGLAVNPPVTSSPGVPLLTHSHSVLISGVSASPSLSTAQIRHAKINTTSSDAHSVATTPGYSIRPQTPLFLPQSRFQLDTVNGNSALQNKMGPNPILQKQGQNPNYLVIPKGGVPVSVLKANTLGNLTLLTPTTYHKPPVASHQSNRQTLRAQNMGLPFPQQNVNVNVIPQNVTASVSKRYLLGPPPLLFVPQQAQVRLPPPAQSKSEALGKNSDNPTNGTSTNPGNFRFQICNSSLTGGEALPRFSSAVPSGCVMRPLQAGASVPMQHGALLPPNEFSSHTKVRPEKHEHCDKANPWLLASHLEANVQAVPMLTNAETCARSHLNSDTTLCSTSNQGTVQRNSHHPRASERWITINTSREVMQAAVEAPLDLTSPPFLRTKTAPTDLDESKLQKMLSSSLPSSAQPARSDCSLSSNFGNSLTAVPRTIASQMPLQATATMSASVNILSSSYPSPLTSSVGCAPRTSSPLDYPGKRCPTTSLTDLAEAAHDRPNKCRVIEKDLDVPQNLISSGPRFSVSSPCQKKIQTEIRTKENEFKEPGPILQTSCAAMNGQLNNEPIVRKSVTVEPSPGAPSSTTIETRDGDKLTVAQPLNNISTAPSLLRTVPEPHYSCATLSSVQSLTLTGSSSTPLQGASDSLGTSARMPGLLQCAAAVQKEPSPLPTTLLHHSSESPGESASNEVITTRPELRDTLPPACQHREGPPPGKSLPTLPLPSRTNVPSFVTNAEQFSSHSNSKEQVGINCTQRGKNDSPNVNVLVGVTENRERTVAKRPRNIGLPVKDFFSSSPKGNTYSSLMLAAITSKNKPSTPIHSDDDLLRPLSHIDPRPTEINGTIIDLTEDDDCEIVGVTMVGTEQNEAPVTVSKESGISSMDGSPIRVNEIEMDTSSSTVSAQNSPRLTYTPESLASNVSSQRTPSAELMNESLSQNLVIDIASPRCKEFRDNIVGHLNNTPLVASQGVFGKDVFVEESIVSPSNKDVFVEESIASPSNRDIFVEGSIVSPSIRQSFVHQCDTDDDRTVAKRQSQTRHSSEPEASSIHLAGRCNPVSIEVSDSGYKIPAFLYDDCDLSKRTTPLDLRHHHASSAGGAAPHCALDVSMASCNQGASEVPYNSQSTLDVHYDANEQLANNGINSGFGFLCSNLNSTLDQVQEYEERIYQIHGVISNEESGDKRREQRNILSGVKAKSVQNRGRRCSAPSRANRGKRGGLNNQQVLGKNTQSSRPMVTCSDKSLVRGEDRTASSGDMIIVSNYHSAETGNTAHAINSATLSNNICLNSGQNGTVDVSGNFPRQNLDFSYPTTKYNDVHEIPNAQPVSHKFGTRSFNTVTVSRPEPQLSPLLLTVKSPPVHGITTPSIMSPPHSQGNGLPRSEASHQSPTPGLLSPKPPVPRVTQNVLKLLQFRPPAPRKAPRPSNASSEFVNVATKERIDPVRANNSRGSSKTTTKNEETLSRNKHVLTETEKNSNKLHSDQQLKDLSSHENTESTFTCGNERSMTFETVFVDMDALTKAEIGQMNPGNSVKEASHNYMDIEKSVEATEISSIMISEGAGKGKDITEKTIENLSPSDRSALTLITEIFSSAAHTNHVQPLSPLKKLPEGCCKEKVELNAEPSPPQPLLLAKVETERRKPDNMRSSLDSIHSLLEEFQNAQSESLVQTAKTHQENGLVVLSLKSQECDSMNPVEDAVNENMGFEPGSPNKKEEFPVAVSEPPSPQQSLAAAQILVDMRRNQIVSHST
ncbi:uncharacterized protein LOC101853412 [Aplysia californica]|uniref:Uncharacterized protein LOC101853412 n=1 Tax=Aplysia californica TaxID=6500 RepID=A0ABM0K4M0_APLCA|nr:uncharacterized protein LOC101853412 [Aplysia californica]